MINNVTLTGRLTRDPELRYKLILSTLYFGTNKQKRLLTMLKKAT